MSATASIEAYYLVGGDDKGGLSVWNLLPVLKRLETEFQILPVEKRVDCANPQRNLRVHATELVKKNREGVEWQAYVNREPQCTFYFEPQSMMPLIHLPTTLDSAYQWQAHSDAVYSVQVIVDNASVTLLTASYDRLVKVWTLTGGCLGSLTQGDMELSRQPYSFPIDYPSRELDKLRNAKAVIKEARHMQQEEDRRSVLATKKKPAAKVPVEATADDDGAEYLFEPTTATTLPPIQKAPRGQMTSFWASRGRKGAKNRVKPVDQKHAGRSFRSLLKKG